jgi:Leucine-rich repeat (LRR) protein
MLLMMSTLLARLKWKSVLCLLCLIVCWMLNDATGYGGVVRKRSRHPHALSCNGNISLSSYDGLKALYESTDGDNWKWNTTSSFKWAFPSSLAAPCTGWYGIVCGTLEKDEGCYVYSITLFNFGLHGYLPTDIGGLADLHDLIITENLLTGTIPSQIGGLTELQTLDLARNFFLEHTIPETVYEMGYLTDIQLQDNLLTGSISSRMGLMKYLQDFDISSNHLSSTLPTELGLLTLVAFEVSANNLNGTLPSELLQIRTTTNLYLDHNSFTGTLASSIGGASSLQAFYLENNMLYGSLPSEFGLLSSLSDAQLNLNTFSGSLSIELCNLTSLTQFGLDENAFSGHIPTCFAKMNWASFNLQQNLFSGSIGVEFCSANSMLDFLVYDNLLTSSLPGCLGNWTRLEVLDVYSNLLSSSLPASIGNMARLLELEIYGNLLTGNVPASFCNLNMQQVLLSNNYFSSSLPPCLGMMANLTDFEVYQNFMSGPLLGSMIPPSLLDLLLYVNMFSGVLPTEIATMSKLQYVLLQNNDFSGSIPVEFQSLTDLRALELSFNMITGIIPEIFDGMSALEEIYISNCLLHGPLPAQLNTYELEFIDVSFNSLTGPIPAAFFFPKAQSLYLNNNMLSGTMSQIQWGEWVQLEVLSLGSNLFTGVLPANVNTMVTFEALIVASNYFSGPLPVNVGNLETIKLYEVSDSYITGTVAAELSYMHRLESLNISGNFLSGNLNKLFENKSALPRLLVFDVSMNGLTGTMPSALFSGNPFRSRLLKDTLLYSNCFESSLPGAICSAVNLTTLILDSMSSAPACQHNFGTMRSIFKVVISSVELGGTIPDCVWNMRTLETLHMSGNGLYGTLGEIAAGATSLTDVSLASNRLVGSIPDSWQTWGRFTQLDLSSNKLTGVLVQNFNISAANTNTDLSVNRISGVIPGAFMDSQNINILDGNLFQCDPNSIPKHDPNSKQYVCGSDDFDISLIVFFCLGACGIVGLAVLYHRVQRALKASSTLLLELERCESESGSGIGHFVGFLDITDRAARWCSVSAVGCLSLSMTAYIILKTTHSSARLYSTHTQQYTWVTTVTFLHGVTPTVLILIFLGLGIVCVHVMFQASARLNSQMTAKFDRIRSKVSADVENINSIDSVEITNSAKTLPGRSPRFTTWVLPIFVMSADILVHAVVTVGINLAYVYALIKGVAPGFLLFLQVLLSVVKLVWNRYFVHRPHFTAAHLPLRIELLCQCFMTLFTFLASPIIATFFLDNTCFRYIILGQPPVDSTFNISPFECPVSCFQDKNGGLPCFSVCGVQRMITQVASTSVVPSWLYSYQCASSVLTNYIPVLLFAYVASGILYPVLQTALTVYGTDVKNWMQQLRSDSRVFSTAEVAGSNGEDNSGLGVVRAPNPLLYGSIALCKLCLNVAVMLTFGLACPLLALAVCVDSWSQVGVLKVLQFKLADVLGLLSSGDGASLEPSEPPDGSIVELSAVHSEMLAIPTVTERATTEPTTERPKEPPAVRATERHTVKFSTVSKATRPSDIHNIQHICLVLEAESRAVFAGISFSLWMAICVSSLFWAFFLFDMMGDVYGNVIGGAIFAVCVVYTVGIYALAGLWPLLMRHGARKLCRGILNSKSRKSLLAVIRGSAVDNDDFL